MQPFFLKRVKKLTLRNFFFSTLFPQTVSTDDTRKSVGWNASGYGDGYESEKKERTIKGDQCDLAKDLPTVKSVFSLGHKDGK